MAQKTTITQNLRKPTKQHTNIAKTPDIAHILTAVWITDLNLAYTSFTTLVIKNAYSFVMMGLYSVMLWCAEEVTPHWSCDEKPVYQQNTTRDSECKKGKRVLAWKWIIFPPSERCRTTTISTSPLLLFSPPVRLPTWVLFSLPGTGGGGLRFH